MMIELKIQDGQDRRYLCAILASAGYAVKVVERSENRFASPEYVVKVFGVTDIAAVDEYSTDWVKG